MILIKWVFVVLFVINAHFLLIIICFVLIFLLYLQSKTTLLSISHFKSKYATLIVLYNNWVFESILVSASISGL